MSRFVPCGQTDGWTDRYDEADSRFPQVCEKRQIPTLIKHQRYDQRHQNQHPALVNTPGVGNLRPALQFRPAHLPTPPITQRHFNNLFFSQYRTVLVTVSHADARIYLQM